MIVIGPVTKSTGNSPIPSVNITEPLVTQQSVMPLQLNALIVAPCWSTFFFLELQHDRTCFSIAPALLQQQFVRHISAFRQPQE